MTSSSLTLSGAASAANGAAEAARPAAARDRAGSHSATQGKTVHHAAHPVFSMPPAEPPKASAIDAWIRGGAAEPGGADPSTDPEQDPDRHHGQDTKFRELSDEPVSRRPGGGRPQTPRVTLSASRPHAAPLGVVMSGGDTRHHPAAGHGGVAAAGNAGRVGTLAGADAHGAAEQAAGAAAAKLRAAKPRPVRSQAKVANLVVIISAVLMVLAAGLAGLSFWMTQKEANRTQQLVQQMQMMNDGSVLTQHVFGGGLWLVERNGQRMIVASKVPPKDCVTVSWYLLKQGKVAIDGAFPQRNTTARLVEMCNGRDGGATITWLPGSDSE